MNFKNHLKKIKIHNNNNNNEYIIINFNILISIYFNI